VQIEPNIDYLLCGLALVLLAIEYSERGGFLAIGVFESHSSKFDIKVIFLERVSDDHYSTLGRHRNSDHFAFATLFCAFDHLHIRGTCGRTHFIICRRRFFLRARLVLLLYC
jgi:hypothetical protein